MRSHFSVISILAIVRTAAANGATCQASVLPNAFGTCPGPPEVYTVDLSPGKGLGVFANHDLEVGDIIMRETPVIKIKPPKVEKGSPYPMSIISSLVREQFEELAEKEQEEVLSLTSHVDGTSQTRMDKLGTIFKNNAYNTGTDIGLFPKIARINHSCRPNLSYYWNESLNKRVVYASRPIKRGEEVFVSYISLLMPHEERQKRLDRYGFTCTCEACSQKSNAMKASDERRTIISKAFQTFEPELVLTPPKSKKVLEKAQKNARASINLIGLVQEEGLADYYAKAYRVAAITHARISDWQTASMWANQGYELRYREDPKSMSTTEMHQLTTSFITSWERELREKYAGS